MTNIQITERQLSEMVVNRIKGVAVPHQYTANRADPTAVEVASCKVAMPSTGAPDDEGTPEMEVQTWDIAYDASWGTRFKLQGGNVHLQAYFEYQDDTFVRNGCWQTDETVAMLITLLADGVWYGENDREPDVQEVFS